MDTRSNPPEGPDPREPQSPGGQPPEGQPPERPAGPPSEPPPSGPPPGYAPPGPQSPGPPPAAPGQMPPPGYGQPPPQAPPAGAPGYGGPVPPGGWQQPLQRPTPPALAGLTLAGWWSRVGAALLDGLILTVALTVAIGVVVGLAFLADQATTVLTVVVAIVGGLLVLALAVLYAPYFMQRSGNDNGQTLGKQIVNIRVIRDNRQPFDWGSAALREIAIKGLLFGIAGSLTAGLAQLLDYLWPLWDDDNQCLHDKVASTYVVRA